MSTCSGLICAAVKALQQELPGVEDAALFFWQLVADAGLNHHRMFAAAYNDGVGSEQNLVSLIGRRALFPQRFRHHPEHGASVQQIGAIGQDGQIHIAERRVAAHQVARGVSFRRMHHGNSGGMR